MNSEEGAVDPAERSYPECLTSHGVHQPEPIPVRTLGPLHLKVCTWRTNSIAFNKMGGYVCDGPKLESGVIAYVRIGFCRGLVRWKAFRHINPRQNPMRSKDVLTDSSFGPITQVLMRHVYSSQP